MDHFDFGYERRDTNTCAQLYHGVPFYGVSLYDLFAWPTKGAGTVGSQYSERIPVTLGSAAVSIVILGIIVLMRNTDWKKLTFYINRLALCNFRSDLWRSV